MWWQAAASRGKEKRNAVHDAFLRAFQGSVAQCITMEYADMRFNPRPIVGGGEETASLRLYFDKKRKQI